MKGFVRCALLLGAAAGGCGGDKSAAAPPPAPGRGVTAMPELTPSAPSDPTQQAPSRKSAAQQVAEAQARLRKAGTQPGAVPPTPSGPASEPNQGDKKPAKPDLPAHLQQGMAAAPSCVQPRPQDSAQKQLGIAVTAHVMATGSVSRAEVSASGLQRSELDCLKRMAEGVRFPTPVEDAPKRVSTTVTLELEAPKPAPQ